MFGALKSVCPVLVVLALTSTPALAFEIHVPSDYPTIQDAIVAAEDGSVILVAPGVYPERIDFLEKSVRVVATNGPEVTIIDGTGLGESVVMCAGGQERDSGLCGFSIVGGDAPVHGGGMCIIASNPTLRNCFFEGNDAVEFGGGMYCENASPAIIGCTFHANRTLASGGEPYGGGGLYNQSSQPLIIDCMFDANEALDNGGGIFNQASSPLILNCLFVRHVNVDGAGMMNNADSNPVIVNSTFTANDSQDQTAGGLKNAEDCDVTLINCIVWGNVPDQILNVSNATCDVRFSDVEGGYSGEGNIAADPLFVAPGKGDWRLDSGSPCIDAADSPIIFDLCTQFGIDPFTADLAGKGRVVNDPGTPSSGIALLQGTTIDMGAFEHQPCVTDVNGDGQVNIEDLFEILNNWGGCP
jgi:hypothetical protein